MVKNLMGESPLFCKFSRIFFLCSSTESWPKGIG
jgi:hypothetical protein